MTKIMTFAAALILVIGVAVVTPAKSEAGPLRDRIRSGQPGPIVQWLQNRPGVFSGQWEGPGFSSAERGGFLRDYFSNYYRVGNVIINGNRWGDLGYRMDHSDLIRW
jgi:hypothetical protein